MRKKREECEVAKTKDEKRKIEERERKKRRNDENPLNEWSSCDNIGTYWMGKRSHNKSVISVGGETTSKSILMIIRFRTISASPLPPLSL